MNLVLSLHVSVYIHIYVRHAYTFVKTAGLFTKDLTQVPYCAVKPFIVLFLCFVFNILYISRDVCPYINVIKAADHLKI